MSDYLNGLSNMVSSIGNEDTGSESFQGGEQQKGLDYSTLDYDVVKFTPAPHNKTNKFDIICFIITQEWYERLLFPPPTQAQKQAGQKYAKLRGRKPGQADFAMEIPFHRFADGNSGDVVCLREAFGDPCPYCEVMFELYRQAREEGNVKAKELASNFSPAWRTFVNIYNYLYESNPNAPEDHSGYEIIDDMGRGSLIKHIQLCSRDTDIGENFVYNYSDPTENGYTIVCDSLYKAPTSSKYNKGYTEFPNIKFEKREKGIDYTIKGEDGLDDIQLSVGFDALVTPLIHTYEKLCEIVKLKKAKHNIVFKEEEESYNTDQTTSYTGTPEGNGNVIPEQMTGTDEIGDCIDDTNSYNQSPEPSKRPGRRSRKETSGITTQENTPHTTAPPVSRRQRNR